MAKLTKKQKEARGKVDFNVSHDILSASSLVKEITSVKFNASVDLAIRLGVDPRKANQMVRGVVPFQMVQVRMLKYWHWLLLTKRRKPKKQVLTT